MENENKLQFDYLRGPWHHSIRDDLSIQYFTMGLFKNHLPVPGQEIGFSRNWISTGGTNVRSIFRSCSMQGLVYLICHLIFGD